MTPLTAVAHTVKFAEKAPLTEHRAITYFVVDCSCGWQSPLCKDRDAAMLSFHDHRSGVSPLS